MNINEFNYKTESKMLNRSYYKVHEKELLKKMPVYSGECIGHQRGNKTIPSIDELQKIAKTAKKVTLTEKGEWLFICGRDVRVKHAQNEAKGIVCVMNQHNECIGYGDYQQEKIINLFDIGDLLRRERKSRKVTKRL
jgi:ribosome biogenesis protein Nip4